MAGEEWLSFRKVSTIRPEYSNFTVEDQGDAFQVGVDVANTGSMDGKHTVQI